NPFVETGVPNLSTPVHGALYPMHWPLLLAPPAVGVALVWLLHTVLAGVFAYFLARELGCRPAAADLSGLVWTLGGYAGSVWGNGEKVLSQAWIPLVALCLSRAARSRRGWPPSIASASVALALIAIAGDPFLWLHALGFAVPIAIVVGCKGRISAKAL